MPTWSHELVGQEAQELLLLIICKKQLHMYQVCVPSTPQASCFHHDLYNPKGSAIWWLVPVFGSTGVFALLQLGYRIGLLLFTCCH